MSNILCGIDITDSVLAMISDCALVVTDSNLKSLYPDFTNDAFVIPAGEKSKDVKTLCAILTEMHKRGLNRKDRVLAFGGGVVGDITGFAAAIYMRGVDWVSIPTSLLAMVDSGIGGKTAVDFDGVKNLVGAFHEPTDVYINSLFLKTLPKREWLCGDGELIKTCLLDSSAYDCLIKNFSKIRDNDEALTFELAQKCASIKNDVVTKDPTEKGLRKVLNVGHTIGHALESLDGYKLSHGEYVLKGMMTEAAMCSEMIGGFYDDYIGMLKSMTAPPTSSQNNVTDFALSDKKNDKGFISIMLPRAPGDITEVKFSPDEFKNRYAEALKKLKG